MHRPVCVHGVAASWERNVSTVRAMSLTETSRSGRGITLATVKAVLVVLLLAALAVELDTLAALLVLRTLR